MTLSTLTVDPLVQVAAGFLHAPGFFQLYSSTAVDSYPTLKNLTPDAVVSI